MSRFVFASVQTSFYNKHKKKPKMGQWCSRCCRSKKNKRDQTLLTRAPPSLESVEEHADEDLLELLPFEKDNFRLQFIDGLHIEEASSAIYESYFDFCRVFGKYQCPLQQLLYDSDHIPKSATHLLCSFTTKDRKQVGIPFHLELDKNRVFPFESLDFVTHRPVRIQVIESDEAAQIVTRDVTDRVHDLSWNNFCAGFPDFRPEAWEWLSEYYPDEEAILVMESENGGRTTLHVHTLVLASFSSP